MTGFIHSFQSLGAADGPGVRFVIFLNGCPLRCAFCHNPDAWEMETGQVLEAADIIKKALMYKPYYGKQGGITVSGGEPLVQAEFVRELFMRAKQFGLNTALDTSGCVINESVRALLDVTDVVLLDYKMSNDEDYFKYTRLEKEKVDSFLGLLEEKNIKTWLRRVIVPTINDDIDGTRALFEMKKRFSCIEKVELLPFRKLCIEKYKEMNIPFPFENVPEAKKELIDSLYGLEK